MLLILVLFIIRPKVVKKPEPFVATIITPEELQPKAPVHVPHAKERSPAPRLPKNLPPPEKFSATPSSHAPAKSRVKSAEPSANNRSAGAGASQRSTVEPTRSQEPGTTQELIKGRESGNSYQEGQGIPSARTTREKLFDKSVIAGLTPNKSDDNGITFDTKEYKYYGYMQRLKEKIEGIWQFPAEAAQRRLNGDVYIRFTINKDGKLSAVELVHTSGYKVLDDGAIRALRDADPYWPLPDSWNMDKLTITGHFVYYFNNTYVR